MNYFSVQSVSLLGMQGIPVEIECVQSRRLPYLQVIGTTAGAAAELRERVLAAIESAGHKLPNRRTTVRIQPGVHGFPLENLDLAVALAILAAGGKIPTQRLEKLLVCGSLGLDGKIQPAGAQRAAQKLFARNTGAYRGALLPLAESSWLPESALAHGGGFESLAEVVDFLRSDQHGRKPPEVSGITRMESDNQWLGSEAELRMLEISAAGEHHLLLFSSGKQRISEFGSVLERILPENAEKNGAGGIHLLHLGGESSLRRHSLLPNSRGSALKGALLHPAEELLRAEHGVLVVENLLKCDLRAANQLFSWMESGRVEWSRAGFSFAEPLEAVAIAEIPPCECGNKGTGLCNCRPVDQQNYQRRLERAFLRPFDLHFVPAATARRNLSLPESRVRVAAARERMQRRQGHLNGQKRAESCGAETWPEKVQLLLRSLAHEAGIAGRRLAAMARVAQTICDLRGGSGVTEADLLEARHYSVLG